MNPSPRARQKSDRSGRSIRGGGPDGVYLVLFGESSDVDDM